MIPATDLEGEYSGFWAFSMAFYGRPGVAAALLALQDDAGLNINLVLFAIWFGLSGRGRLDARRIAEASRAAQSIEVEVIDPLRALRRRLKAALESDVQSLRESIKALEMEAEKAAQARLAAFAGPTFKTEPTECVRDAVANLALYLGPATAFDTHAAIIRRELGYLTGHQ
jgi:uncharacterized protein (TIGR02444 family)